MFTKISDGWKKFRTSPSGLVSMDIALLALGSLHLISSFITTYSYFSIPTTRHEGWILVRINGFGYTMYQESIDFNDFKPFKYNYLSRSSKIITMIYTSATPKSLDTKDQKDVSVLTNRDDETTINNQLSEKFSKKNSQSYQSLLVSLKESRSPVCLYVKGIRDGESSSYLNILKIKLIEKEDIDRELKNSGQNINIESMAQLKDEDRNKKIQRICDPKQNSVLK